MPSLRADRRHAVREAAAHGLDLDHGVPRVDPATGATSLPGLYAGGDCVSRGAEVVNAVEEGKIAARGIAAYLADGAAVS